MIKILKDKNSNMPIAYCIIVAILKVEINNRFFAQHLHANIQSQHNITKIIKVPQ